MSTHTRPDTIILTVVAHMILYGPHGPQYGPYISAIRDAAHNFLHNNYTPDDSGDMHMLRAYVFDADDWTRTRAQMDESNGMLPVR